MSEFTKLLPVAQLAQLENYLRETETELYREAFSPRSLYCKTLVVLFTLVGATLCAIVGINSINVIFFVISLILQIVAAGFVYTFYHPSKTLYYKADNLVETFLRYNWQSKEAKAILREELNARQDGISIDELHLMIKLEKKEIARESTL